MIPCCRRLAAGVLLAASFLLGACGGLPRAPEIGFSGVEWLGAGEVRGEQRFVLRLTLKNPNRSEIHLESLAAELVLDSVALGRGWSEGAVVLPPEGEAELALVCLGRLDQALALWTKAQFTGRETLPYRLTGRALLQSYGEVPLERRGEVSLKQLGRWRKGVRSDDRPL